MRIRGLSNQWHTRDGLFNSFALELEEDSDADVIECVQMMQVLFRQLESVDGPDLWGGTSHGLLQLLARDVREPHEHASPLVTVETIKSRSGNAGSRPDQPVIRYRVGYRLVVGQRPTNRWIHRDVDDVSRAMSLIMEAVAYLGVPIRQIPDVDTE